MDRQYVLTILLAGLTLTAGCSFFASNPESYTSTYDYRVGVDATGTLSNATIRVPLPQVDGEATYDASVVEPNGAFDAAVVETQYGPMLELTADEFVVETRYFRFVEEDGMGRREEIDESQYDPSNPDHHKQAQRTVSVSVTREATYPIDTRTPVGESPTFYGEGVTRELADCRMPYPDETACFAYDAPIYLSYDAREDARVSGNVVFTGSNEWFAGGWTGNSYADRVAFAATGPQDGWLIVNGTTEVGQGTYPSPER
jgi:hypothetical protein